MCKQKSAGLFGSAMADRELRKHEQKIREQTIREISGQPQRAAQTPTQFAQKVLAVTAGVWLLGGGAAILLHAALVTLACLAAVTVAGLAVAAGFGVRAAVRQVRSVNRQVMTSRADLARLAADVRAVPAVEPRVTRTAEVLAITADKVRS